jgi:hypothetical protein
MSSVTNNVQMCKREGEKKGQWALSKGTKIGTVDSEHGASKGRGSQLCTKSHHAKQEGNLLYSIFINTVPQIYNMSPYFTFEKYILSSAG